MDDLQTEQTALQERVTTLETQLRARLSPEDFQLVRQLCLCSACWCSAPRI